MKLKSILIRKAKAEEQKVKTYTHVQKSGFRDSARVKRLRQSGVETVQDSKVKARGGVAGCKIEAQCRLCARLCLSSKCPQTAYRPMMMVRIYFHILIYISQRDRARTFTLSLVLSIFTEKSPRQHHFDVPSSFLHGNLEYEGENYSQKSVFLIQNWSSKIGLHHQKSVFKNQPCNPR